jgi:hypothetical protein
MSRNSRSKTMSDERQAFEQLHAIPSGAEWCEKRHIYIHKNYSGLVLHPINESWEAFCEGALWQASREGGEPIGFLQSSGVSQLSGGHPAKLYPIGATPSPFESSTLVYTHPASADVPEKWRTVMKELAADLESEVESRRSGELDRRIERDLIVVKEARVLLDEQEQGQ